jgi:aerobic carbon-monoxide dehydrogenase large subunit
VLGVPYQRIRVVHGQTDRIARGMGAFASRVTVMTGSAIVLAARRLRDRLLAKAAEMLQAPRDAVTIEADRIARIGGEVAASVALGAVAAACARDDGTPCLSEAATFESDHMTYPYGVHLAVARVDPETYGVVLERFVAAFDIGCAVNPLLVDGQIAGGAAQGIGGALLEEFVYDDTGQPLATTLADYLMPTLAELPPVELLLAEDAPSPLNPLGVKGAGEGGITGAGAAIAAALDAAFDGAIRIDRLPVTPSRLQALVAAAGAGSD